MSSSPDLHELHLERKLALAGPEFLTIVVASLSSLSPSYHSKFPPRTFCHFWLPAWSLAHSCWERRVLRTSWPSLLSELWLF